MVFVYKHIREWKQRQSGVGNPFYGKTHSDETRKKLRDINLGNVMSDETKQKMSESHTGKKHPITTCPYCKKTGGIRAMTRYHFDNCKSKK